MPESNHNSARKSRGGTKEIAPEHDPVLDTAVDRLIHTAQGQIAVPAENGRAAKCAGAVADAFSAGLREAQLNRQLDDLLDSITEALADVLRKFRNEARRLDADKRRALVNEVGKCAAKFCVDEGALETHQALQCPQCKAADTDHWTFETRGRVDHPNDMAHPGDDYATCPNCGKEMDASDPDDVEVCNACGEVNVGEDHVCQEGGAE